MLLEAGRSFSPAVMSQTDEDEVDSAFHAEGVRVSFLQYICIQRAKKVVSDSLGLVDFAIGLVNSVFNLPDGQVIFV